MDGRVILVWGGVAAIILVIVTLGLAAGHRPKLDADLCPAADLQAGQTIVMVDETDAYSPEQAETLKPILLDARDRLPKYARLSVVPIGDDVQEPPITAFSLCNPGRGDQVNGLIETDRSATTFDKPLDGLIAALETQKTQLHSPILQTIASVARLPSFAHGRRELDIVSDLLENSALFTQYHDGPGDFSRFSASPDYAAVKADLTGVAVRLFYLKRPETEAVQSDAQRAFWIAYFRASHVNDVSWCAVGSASADRKEVLCEPALN